MDKPIQRHQLQPTSHWFLFCVRSYLIVQKTVLQKPSVGRECVRVVQYTTPLPFLVRKIYQIYFMENLLFKNVHLKTLRLLVILAYLSLLKSCDFVMNF